ncbi:metallophosphoesterase family protein [Deinococcus fonticola]|uniref:metallophosphoesterase family protein n=1 Tax=Deinococcus fonticola TaxID=2528713 RepID=UPI0010750E7B|nr:metallophosphoesterase family protein [Deinococcus fonticola]
MRVAILSDTHGNAFALEAVLRDIRQASPDVTINLGDQIEGSADPGRAAALQASLNAVEVRGNNEEKLWAGGRRSPLSREIGAWLDNQVSAQARARLAALPLSARVEGGIFACHGTPQSAWDSLLWMWDQGGYYRARAPRELRQLVEPLAAQVVVCGHTHRPGATRVGDTLVVNSGAVSGQVDGDPRARWTLLERRGGHWSADFRAASYDIEAAVAWSVKHSPFGEFEAGLLRSGEMSGRGTS